MDLRNVIFAIALSFAVLFGWSVIFETPEIEKQKKSQKEKNQRGGSLKKKIINQSAGACAG